MLKKGLMNIGAKFSSFVVGVVFIVLGLLSVIGNFYDVSFLPVFFFEDLFLKIILVLGGLFLLYDSFKIGYGMMRVVSFFAGVLVFLIGFIPILIHFKLLNFLPYFATLTLPSEFIKGIVVFFGVYLVIDSFIMRAKEEE